VALTKSIVAVTAVRYHSFSRRPSSFSGPQSLGVNGHILEITLLAAAKRRQFGRPHLARLERFDTKNSSSGAIADLRSSSLHDKLVEGLQ
jgi:hypothetical protein